MICEIGDTRAELAHRDVSRTDDVSFLECGRGSYVDHERPRIDQLHRFGRRSVGTAHAGSHLIDDHEHRQSHEGSDEIGMIASKFDNLCHAGRAAF